LNDIIDLAQVRSIPAQRANDVFDPISRALAVLILDEVLLNRFKVRLPVGSRSDTRRLLTKPSH
jgi:hypothetical protein